MYVAGDGAVAVRQAPQGAGRILTLILPVNTAWGTPGHHAKPLRIVDLLALRQIADS